MRNRTRIAAVPENVKPFNGQEDPMIQAARVRVADMDDSVTDQTAEDEQEERRAAFARSITKGSQLLDIVLPPKKVIVDDWFKEGDLGFLYASRGAGKTWLGMGLCVHLAEGTKFGPWQVHDKWPVLYVDGEMSLADDRERTLGLNDQKVPEELHVLNHEVLFHLEELVMNFGRRSDQEILTQLCLEKGIKVLVLDNLGCLFTGVGENDADEWEKVLPWLLELRRHRIAVIIVHHTGHDSSNTSQPALCPN
jgi:hypothetical protein